MQGSPSIRWNAYPALFLAAAFALGIGMAEAYRTVSTPIWLAAALGGWLAGGALLNWPRRRLVTLRPLWITLVVGFCVLAAGGARTALFHERDANRLATLVPSHADVPGTTLTGRVAGAVSRTPDGARFTMHADTLMHGTDTLAVQGQVRTFLRSSPWETTHAAFPNVRQGDQIVLHGRLQALPSRRNPADFDYGAYLRRRGIHAIVQVNAPRDVTITARSSHPVWSSITTLRARIDRRIHHRVEISESRAVLRALLLGDRGYISETMREQFIATGLLHLLAISGLHVLLVGMVIYTLLRPTLIRLRLRWVVAEWIRATVTLFLLIAFALLTGGRPSVVRAVAMAGLFIGANVLQRDARSLNTLGVAALGLLVHRPTMLFDAGFQLSFAAVGGILLVNPRLRDLLPEAWRRGGLRGQVASLTTVSVAATLGTMPVLLVHFGYVSFAGLVLNVIAVPVTALALLSALLAIGTSGWGVVGTSFGHAAEALTQGLLHTASVGAAHLGWASVTATVRDPWIVLALGVGVLAIAHYPHPRWRWRLMGAALLCVCVSLWTGILTGSSGSRVDVVFFDVGQGDAALVSFPSGRHVLVDAGPRNPYFDAGRSVILPHLQRYGIDRLDAVVVSHGDADHLGGLPAILRVVPVRRLVMNPPAETTALTREVDHLIDSLSVPRRPAYAGDTLAIDSAARIQVLGPPGRSRLLNTDNEASMVVRMVYGTTRFLFTGDIEQQGEQWLVEHYNGLLSSEVVKVGHHGSPTSSSSAFIRQAVVPDSSTSVVSVGRRNPFGFPAPEVVHRWEAEGASVRTTATCGAVWIRSSGRRHWEVTWR